MCTTAKWNIALPKESSFRRNPSSIPTSFWEELRCLCNGLDSILPSRFYQSAEQMRWILAWLGHNQLQRSVTEQPGRKCFGVHALLPKYLCRGSKTDLGTEAEEFSFHLILGGPSNFMEMLNSWTLHEKEKAAKIHIEPNTLYSSWYLLEPATCMSGFLLFSYESWTCWSILGFNRPAYTIHLPMTWMKVFRFIENKMNKLYADLAQNSWTTHCRNKSRKNGFGQWDHPRWVWGSLAGDFQQCII